MRERHRAGCEKDCLLDVGIGRPSLCDDAKQGSQSMHLRQADYMEGRQQVKQSEDAGEEGRRRRSGGQQWIHSNKVGGMTAMRLSLESCLSLFLVVPEVPARKAALAAGRASAKKGTELGLENF